MSFPSKRMLPSVGVSNPAIIRKVVVFPQPDGPNRVTNSPGFIVRLKSLTIYSFPSKLFPIPLSSIILSIVIPPHFYYFYIFQQHD